MSVAPLVSFKLLQRKRCTKPTCGQVKPPPLGSCIGSGGIPPENNYKSIISSSSAFFLSGSILPRQLQWASGETNTTEMKLFFASFLLPVSFFFSFFPFVTAKLVSIGSFCFFQYLGFQPPKQSYLHKVKPLEVQTYLHQC